LRAACRCRNGQIQSRRALLRPCLDPRTGDFHRIDNDPFAVIDQVRFQSTIEDGFASGDAAKGTIPPLTLEVWSPDRGSPLVPRDKLLAMFLALLRACQREKPALIGVPAAPIQVLALTRQLIAWLPLTLRLWCSFDTLSNGRNLTQLPFAIAGLPAAGPPRRYLNLVSFDVVRHAFSRRSRIRAHRPIINGCQPRPDKLNSRRRCSATKPPINLHRASTAVRSFNALGWRRSLTLRGNRLHRCRCSEGRKAVASRLQETRVKWSLRCCSRSLQLAAQSGLEGICKLGEPIDATLVLRWLLAIYDNARATRSAAR